MQGYVQILFQPETVQSLKELQDIDSVYVTDYYNWRGSMDPGHPMWIGSDVYGPMGREVIPFKDEASAREFLKDHKGKSEMILKEVVPR